METFKHASTIRLSQTDAGGVVYFAEYFNIAHQCYEAFLDTVMPVQAGIEAGILMPIVHAEADYQSPLRVSEKIVTELSTHKIKRSSYVMDYRIQKEDGSTAVTVQTVHAVIDLDWKPQRIPTGLKEALGQMCG